MPGTIPFFGFLFRYIWPFIKEWFFDKRTIINWFKKNYVVFCLLLAVVFQGYLTWKMLLHTIAVKAQATTIQAEYKKVQDELTWRRQRMTTLSAQIKTTLDEREALRDKINTYEHWMSACGMNFNAPETEMPTCTNGRSSATSTSASSRSSTGSKPRRKPSKSSNNSELADRVKQIWGQHE